MVEYVHVRTGRGGDTWRGINERFRRGNVPNEKAFFDYESRVVSTNVFLSMSNVVDGHASNPFLSGSY